MGCGWDVATGPWGPGGPYNAYARNEQGLSDNTHPRAQPSTTLRNPTTLPLRTESTSASVNAQKPKETQWPPESLNSIKFQKRQQTTTMFANTAHKFDLGNTNHFVSIKNKVWV